MNQRDRHLPTPLDDGHPEARDCDCCTAVFATHAQPGLLARLLGAADRRRSALPPRAERIAAPQPAPAD